MSSIDIPTLESFLFSEKTDDFLKKLIQGTDAYYNYTLTNALNKQGVDLTPEQVQLLEKNQSQRTHQDHFGVHLRYLLLKLQTASNEKERSKIIDQLNSSYLSYSFGYQQPVNITSNLIQQQSIFGSQKMGDSLNEEELSLNTYLQYPYIYSLTQESVAKIDPKNLENLDHHEKQVYLSHLMQSICLAKGIPKFLKGYYEKGGAISQDYIARLSIDQMKELVELRPQMLLEGGFFAMYLLKTFKLDSRVQSNLSGLPTADKYQQKKEILSKIRDWVKKLPIQFIKVGDFFLRHLLLLDMSMNIYDFDMFVEFLKEPTVEHNNFNTFWKQRYHQNQQNTVSSNSRQVGTQALTYLDQVVVFLGLQNHKLTDDQIIKKYLHKYVLAYEKFDLFTEYFELSYLQKELAKIQLLKGKSVPDITKHFSSEIIQQLTDRKVIRISNFNKPIFREGEEVKIDVQLKNIPQLTVKVFEFNTENYYRKNLKEIDNSMELDGLIASEESFFEFTHPPIQKFSQTFKFDNIATKKQGVFIIDFLGNGIQSRAIIKKGCLLLREKQTIAGHAFQIHDENLEICTGDKTGIFFQQKYYPLNSDNEVLIPFTDRVVTEKAIVIHNDFSSLADVTIQQETYHFRCGFITNNESMLMSSKALVLLQPRLYLNQMEVPLQLLQDCKVVVSSTNQMGISTSTTHGKISFSEKKEVEIEIPVQAKIHSISIAVEGKVKTMTHSKSLFPISASHTIAFNQHQSDDQFCIQNLRLTKNGYEIYLTGQNGEPKAGVTLNLNFSIKGYNGGIAHTLVTNSEGFVRLHSLKNVKQVISSVETQGDISANQRIWQIENTSQINYPETLTITTSDAIDLPYLNDDLSEDDIVLLSVMDTNSTDLDPVISVETSKVQLKEKSIHIDPLPAGMYRLHFRSFNQTVTISVEEGVYWKGTASIQTQDGLICQRPQNKFLYISNINVETPKEDQSGYTVKVQLNPNTSKLTRAHVMLFTYLPDHLVEPSSRLQVLTKKSVEKDLDTKAAQVGNQYQSNKVIGDEIRYALDRKRHQRFIGNTLEKPKLLLKRNFFRDTNYDTEELNGGGGFQQESQKRQPVASQSSKKEKRSLSRLPSSGPSIDFGSNTVDTFNNYLLNPSLILSNLIPDENGLITIPNVQLNKYSTLQVVATDFVNSVTKIEPLDKGEIAKRNLSQRKNAQMDKFFTISRSNELIVKGSEFKSSDFTSTEIQLVDSIPKLFAAQKELRKVNGGDKEQTNGYDFWDFLVKWTSYSLDQKHKKYNQNSCHELNLFIYCKDPPFFNDFVKPFISNKIEKSFIDHFLMNDTSYLDGQSSAYNTSQLNALELVLLIFYLQKSNKLDEAKGVFSYLESSFKIKKQETHVYKKLFDTVLNAKTEAEGEENSLKAGIAAAYTVAATTTSSAAGGFAQPSQPGFGFGGIHSNMNMNMNNNAFAFQPMMMQQQQQQAYPMQQMYQQQAYLPPQQQQMQQQAYQPYPSAAPQQLMRNSMNNYAAMDLLMDDPFYGEGQAAYKYAEKRGGFVKQYQNIEKTKEYCERHYFSQKGLESQTSRVPVNGFWVDLARHILTHGQEKPFLSANFIYCAHNHTQMIAALSFLALPFEATSHTYEPYEGKGIKVIMSSNSIVFSKQIKEGQANLRDDILVSQKFFDPNDRYVFSDENPDDRYEKQITEYVIDKRYGCQVIVTNCSALKHELQVFVEIPSGSIPVKTNDYMKTHNITLEPFSTKPIEFYFYFPANGEQTIYPSNVSKNGQIVAVAKPATFDVKETRTVSNLETMNEILQKGSKEDILKFISSKNILNTNIFSFDEVYYLLKEKQFYTKFIEILQNRKVFNEVAWSYSIYHKDLPTFLELINSDAVQSRGFQSKLPYSNTSSIYDTHRFFEYSPLSNPRVHMLHQDKSNILNVQFRERYLKFLIYLSVKPEWSVADKLGIVYYFLLQDRIEEAINIYKSITEESVNNSPNCQLQYDYFTSYLDFFIGFPNFKRARELCEKYLDYPILQWRNLFYEVANKLAEYDGEEEDLTIAPSEQTEEEQKESQKKKNNKKKEDLNEVLNVAVNQTVLEVQTQNISSLTVSYYLIDLEILFSRNPFLSKEKSDFSFVKPNHSEVVSISNSQSSSLTKTQINIPDKFHKFNVCIEVSTPNVQKSLTYFSTSLQVEAVVESGQIKVTDKDEKPLSKVYVKAFTKKKDNTVVFYKDGYTDLVGRFDYSSRNSSDVSQIQSFAIFVMSDELGALIKEVNPPSSVGQIVEEVKLRGAQWNQRADVRSNNQKVSYANHQVQQQQVCKNAFF